MTDLEVDGPDLSDLSGVFSLGVEDAADPGGSSGTSLILLAPPADPSEQGQPVIGGTGSTLPRVVWVGPRTHGLNAADVAALVGTSGPAPSVHRGSGRALAIVPELSHAWFGRPGLQGHRRPVPGAGDGRDESPAWASAFTTDAISSSADSIDVRATDSMSGLSLHTEIQAVSGGAIRIRHAVTNEALAPFVVDSLDVILPVPDRVGEIVESTGRWGRERSPQRHQIVDGLWLRESRTGRPGPESATVLHVGTTGFGFRSGEVWGIHLAWSGNSRHFVERLPSGQTVIGAGELLLPGEIVLDAGQTYTTPWLFVAASAEGLDEVAHQFHRYLRAQPAHPGLPRPVTCNVWEAVYFDHDLNRLRELATVAARTGVERFVLDDGWFGDRRHDRAGLGDWVVSAQAWPDGLGELVEHVTGIGMQFGLWFEPEMVNRDSELYRAHPDWILAVPGREPEEFRHQLALDLGRPEVRDHLFGQVSAVLSQYPIGYVKWDHNRPLADAGTGAHGGAPGVHENTLGYYALLDRLRAAHPDVEWEACASGGSRIDLAVLERVQRVWTSDMTDALSRQLIQRWTAQLVPPEYLGAHVSAPVNHQTGRALSLDMRAATAFFGDFGVEWDLTSATDDERALLAGWIGLYKQHRPLLHTGDLLRVDNPNDTQLTHGVVAGDRSQAVIAYVQLDETVHDPLPIVVPDLEPSRRYRVSVISPAGSGRHPELGSIEWAGNGLVVSGAALAAVGLPAAQRWPQSALVIHLDGRD